MWRPRRDATERLRSIETIDPDGVGRERYRRPRDLCSARALHGRAADHVETVQPAESVLVVDRVLEGPAERLGLAALPLPAAVLPRQHRRGRVVVLHRVEEVYPHGTPER